MTSVGTPSAAASAVELPKASDRDGYTNPLARGDGLPLGVGRRGVRRSPPGQRSSRADATSRAVSALPPAQSEPCMRNGGTWSAPVRARPWSSRSRPLCSWWEQHRYKRWSPSRCPAASPPGPAHRSGDHDHPPVESERPEMKANPFQLEEDMHGVGMKEKRGAAHRRATRSASGALPPEEVIPGS